MKISRAFYKNVISYQLFGAPHSNSVRSIRLLAVDAVKVIVVTYETAVQFYLETPNLTPT